MRLIAPIASPLFAHITQRVFGTALLELVEHDHVGEIEHVDFLELTGRAVFARHDVHRDIDQIGDLGIGLPDACGLDDDEIEVRQLQQANGVPECSARRTVLTARGERTHENVRRGERVHANAIAEQCSARATTGRIHRDDGDVAIRKMAHEPLQQLIVETRLAGAAGAGQSHDRNAVLHFRQRPADRLIIALFQRRDGLRNLSMITRIQRRECKGRSHRISHALQHVIDHPVQTEATTIFGRVDPLDSMTLERFDFVRRNGAATAHDDANVTHVQLAQHVHHVREVLVMATLIRGHGDGVRILLDGGAHDLGDAAVMTEMHHLCAVRLEQAPDHVDRCVVTVEQRRRRHETQRLLAARRQWRSGRKRRRTAHIC